MYYCACVCVCRLSSVCCWRLSCRSVRNARRGWTLTHTSSSSSSSTHSKVSEIHSLRPSNSTSQPLSCQCFQIRLQAKNLQKCVFISFRVPTATDIYEETVILYMNKNELRTRLDWNFTIVMAFMNKSFFQWIVQTTSQLILNDSFVNHSFYSVCINSSPASAVIFCVCVFWVLDGRGRC